MALIACPECGNEVSDKAPTCPKCGVPVNVASELIVAAPVQSMAMNPKIRVEWQGREVAKLAKGESVTIPVDSDGEARFSASIRSSSLQVKTGRVTRVQLSWDRFTGKLIAQQVERIGGTAPF